LPEVGKLGQFPPPFGDGAQVRIGVEDELRDVVKK
jgi:hypothetical protein